MRRPDIQARLVPRERIARFASSSPSPVWAPSRAFGGPVVAAGELVRRLWSHGQRRSTSSRPRSSTSIRVRALRSSIGSSTAPPCTISSTPLRYRWMGITPTLPLALARLHRPDVVHVFGFRDPVTTGDGRVVPRSPASRTSSSRSGMFEPRLRKVALKRALDATLYRGVARGAAAVVVASEREADDGRRSGRAGREGARARQRLSRARARSTANDDLRSRLGIPRRRAGDPLRRAGSPQEKESSTCSTRRASFADAQLVDRRAGRPSRHVGARPPSADGRVDAGPRPHPAGHARSRRTTCIRRRTSSSSPLRARASGSSRRRRPRRGRRSIVSDRCGIAGFFRGRRGARRALRAARRSIDAVRQVLSDEQLRERLGRGGVAAARRTSWDHVTDVQEEIYRDVASRTAATKLSTEGS